MSKSRFSTFLIFFFATVFSIAQDKYEREHRIRKSQFPGKALAFIKDKVVDAKRMQFYKEVDSFETSYKAKFKKDRLRYAFQFNSEGDLHGIGIQIKNVDIPEDVLTKMTDYLEKGFSKYKIRKMQQQYKVEDDVETTLKNAFQNLMLPSIMYRLIVSGKKDGDKAQYEVSFNADGRFENIRESLPPNYDHVLY